MITDETRDILFELIKAGNEKNSKDLEVGENTLCEGLDAIIEHLMLEDAESFVTSGGEEGESSTEEFAHRAMHWAFALGVGWALKSRTEISITVRPLEETSYATSKYAATMPKGLYEQLEQIGESIGKDSTWVLQQIYRIGLLAFESDSITFLIGDELYEVDPRKEEDNEDIA